MMEERGMKVCHTTVYRWVQKYAPEIEKRLRWRWKPGHSSSWQLDETYVNGQWTDAKEKAKMVRYLQYRGYNMSVIMESLS